jgi:hypothetical protein
MSVCEYCNQEMTEVKTCKKVPIMHNGKEYEPIKYGDEKPIECDPRIKQYFIRPERCHDCGVEKGGYHHPGCDVEECPVCHGQLITCGCIDEEDNE